MPDNTKTPENQNEPKWKWLNAMFNKAIYLNKHKRDYIRPLETAY